MRDLPPRAGSPALPPRGASPAPVPAPTGTRLPTADTSARARTRLDTELVRRGLARSRTHAARLVTEGRVSVDGRPASRPAQSIAASAEFSLADAADFASRAGGKLDDALAGFTELVVSGRRCLDAGSSTGGFTDVLLRRGAASVVAVDVGTGQLRPELANDPRVDVREGTDIRDLAVGSVPGGAVELGVVDLSFISVTKVLPALTGLVRPDGDLVILVKPQFEVGRHAVGRGVVADPELWRQAVAAVAAAGRGLGWQVRGEVPSTVPGKAGNREFVLWLSRVGPTPTTEVRR